MGKILKFPQTDTGYKGNDLYKKEGTETFLDESMSFNEEKILEADSMDWQEKYIEKVDGEITEINSEIKGMENRIGNRIDSKLEEFRNEMRHLDNQRVDDMREIRTSLDSTNKHVQGMVTNVHNISIAVIIGVAAMVISVMALGYSIWNGQNDLNKQLLQQSQQIQEIQRTNKMDNAK